MSDWVVVRYDDRGNPNVADLPDDNAEVEMWRHNGQGWAGVTGRCRRVVMDNGLESAAIGRGTMWFAPPADVPLPGIDSGVVWRYAAADADHC